MYLNISLLLVAALAAVLTLVRAIRSPLYNSRGWIYASVGVLVAAVISWLLVPTLAGYIAIATWALFVFVPAQGFRALSRLIYRGKYGRARQLARFLRWLHPFADWRWEDATLQAYDRASQGDVSGALEILANNQPRDRRLRQHSEIYVYRLTGDWKGLLSWLRERLEAEEELRSPEVVALYVRALGETGELNGMIEAFQQYKPLLAQVSAILRESHLPVFAFCGRRELVEKIFESGTLGKGESDLQAMWLGTAELAAGETEAGRARLAPLLQADNHMFRLAAGRRLSEDMALAEKVLTPESARSLAIIEQEWAEDRPMSYTVDGAAMDAEALEP
jgi:rhomboid protease GluP